ncbi:MAG: hypothetical protein ACR2L6_04440 [Gemmatimonadaceae bacterium]
MRNNIMAEAAALLRTRAGSDLQMMRLEYLPIILGVVVLLAAAGVIYDTFSPEGLPRFFRDRRRRARAERSRNGQGLIGAGMAALAAALIGSDVWRFGTVAVLVGGVLLIAGGIMNRAYLKEALLNRGVARRRDPEDQPPEQPESKTYRIR